MFPGLSTEIIIDILDTFGFGLLFVGILFSCAAAFRLRIKWIFATLAFLGSAASFLFLAWFSPGFSWDVVPVAIIDIILSIFCLRTQSL